jgi:predicted O-methyltransferase YrrM
LTKKQWAAVDRYFSDLLVGADPAAQAAEASRSAALPPIAVSPNEGKLLHLLAKIQRARRILEIGTLGGYSTIWLARALPSDGRLVTLEFDPRHAEVARINIQRAGLAGMVDIRVGRALDSLPRLAEEGFGPIDLTFIDADKENNADYFAWALRLSRPGGVIVIDNVVRDGEIIDGNSRDPNILGVRRMNEMIAAEPRVSATAIQTVGGRGYDGFAIAVVADDV